MTAQVGMDEPLFRISLDGKVRHLTTEGRVTNVISTEEGGAAFTLDSLLLPADLYRVTPDGQLHRLTAINEDRLRDIDIPRLERFEFEGAKGATVSPWMLTPEASRDALPTVLLVHDGLHGEPANSWSRRWNPLLFSAPGYAVIGVDFHGTAGYGKAFTQGKRLTRDALALEDLRLGLAAAASRSSKVRSQNVCIAGDGAYGGYLAYRIAGEWSRQPRCLIVNGGVVDGTTMSFQTDEPWMHNWEEASVAADRNRARAWRTPLLILHGERNFRVPYPQSVMAFTVAQRRDVPSRLVVFPEEGAWVQAPKNTIQWYGEVFNWLDRWLPPVGDFAASSPVGDFAASSPGERPDRYFMESSLAR